MSPLRSLFNCKFTPIHQLLVLTYLGKLAQHWASMEYERCKNCANGPFPMTNSPIFGGPLDSIFGLVETISQMAESGLCQLVQKVEDPDVHKLHLNIYIQETLVIFLTVSNFLKVSLVFVKIKNATISALSLSSSKRNSSVAQITQSRGLFFALWEKPNFHDKSPGIFYIGQARNNSHD